MKTAAGIRANGATNGMPAMMNERIPRIERAAPMMHGNRFRLSISITEAAQVIVMIIFA